MVESCREEMNKIRKKDEACFWLLCWLRGSVFRKFSTERMAVVGKEGQEVRCAQLSNLSVMSWKPYTIILFKWKRLD